MIATRYRIVDRLGATSFLVEETANGRRAALQMVRGDTAKHEAVARCFTEACLASSLDHPGIARVYDVGTTLDGDPFVVGEVVTAPTLSSRLARGPLKLQQALEIARDIALVLVAAHDRGIAHGSLRPDVIRVDGATVKLTGFGEAAVANERALPIYTSPEQCRVNGSYDARSDLYALGCVLVEMLTGRRPFESTDASELRTSHLLAPPRSVRGPAGALVARMLAKQPDARPAAAEVAATLAGLLQALEPPRSGHPAPWFFAFALGITAVISTAYDLGEKIDRLSPLVFHEMQRASLSP